MSLSSQSPATSTNPMGSEQAVTVSRPVPKPSASVSAYQTTASLASSSFPLQLLSVPLQVSAAPGWIFASKSSQSDQVSYPSPSRSPSKSSSGSLPREHAR